METTIKNLTETFDNINEMQPTDFYWSEREKFVNMLRDFLSHATEKMWQGLTKDEYANLVLWCSRFRPFALHTMFLTLSKVSKYAND